MITAAITDPDDKSRFTAVSKVFQEPDVYYTMAQLAAVRALVDDIPEIIEKASGNAEKFERGLVVRLETVAATLKEATTADGAAAVAAQALNASPCHYSASQTAKFTTLLIPLIKEAAAAGLASYEAHVEPMLVYYNMRIRFDHTSAPEPYTGDSKPASIAAFLGCEPADAVLALLTEYRRFCLLYPTVTDAEKALKQSEFWQAKAPAFPRLAKLGCWYAEMPMSSVAAERMFGIMRQMDVPQRSSMKEPAFEAEWMARVNGWLTKKLLTKALEDAKHSR